MTTPITVLMSVYNGVPYLQDAIDSILKQTFTDFKFLIIDDASTDGSSLVLAEYAKRDSRIEILTNDLNYGLGYSLAYGLKVAKTPWVARMDADDIAVPNRLELQMDYLSKHPNVDILGGYALEISEHGEPLHQRRVPTYHDDIYRLIWTNPFIHATVLFRREAILKVGSYYSQLRIRIPEDYELWFRCAVAGCKFANLDVPLIHYRFSKKTFERNNWQFLIAHLLIGWRGCWMVGCSPMAYIGTTKPLLIGLLPTNLRYVVYRWLSRFDPRQKVS